MLSEMKSDSKKSSKGRVSRWGVSSAIDWLQRHSGTILLTIFWCSLNGILFFFKYYEFKLHPKYHYLREMLGLGLCISRGSAAVLNLNCAMILLPMCRCIVSLCRGSRLAKRYARRCLDRGVILHVLCAVLICLAAAVHCTAHVMNAVNFTIYYNDDVVEVNVATKQNEEPFRILFCTVPGLTGVLMVLILVLIIVASSKHVRLVHYELFWYTHHLFVVFYGLLLMHSASGVLKEQTNLAYHTPGCSTGGGQPEPEPEPEHAPFQLKLFGMTEIKMAGTCKEPPYFKSHPSQTWCFVVFPLILYIIERFIRLCRGRQTAEINSTIYHYPDVIEIQISKKGFQAKPGQYISLNCPTISALEWHPFTLTKCPSLRSGSFSVHVRVLGDWTVELRDMLHPVTDVLLEKGRHAYGDRRYPRLYIDGPFGSPNQDVFKYHTSVCIAGGVGVTPYAAVLNQLRDCDLKKYKLQRLYFIWVCRNIQNLKWFADLLASVHGKFWNENMPDFLNIRLFVTSKHAQIRTAETTDRLTGFNSRDHFLANRIHIGRPDLKEILGEVDANNKRSSIGLFVCGPKKLSNNVQNICNRINRKRRIKMQFNTESFS
ncbi:NADPH oxidase 4-like [Antedon mediterranea]|uniref:NADPH oxidase 4-like n=1 Tax=Antedon mediterranea TaxID=105859 RepID=UPI003AF700E2